MTKEETKQILKVLRISYPNSFKNLTNEDTYLFLDLWSEAFKEEPVEIVIQAVKSIIYTDTREFAPNIATVRRAIYKLLHKDELNEIQAWELVAKALTHGISNPKGEYEKLPEEIKEVVGSPRQLTQWAMLDDFGINQVSRDFQKNFKSIKERKMENWCYPNEFKQLTEKVVAMIESRG